MSTFLPYNQIYPVLGFIVRGSLSKLWIHKQYKTFKYVAKYYYPYNPRTAEQQAWRAIFADAVSNWQGFDIPTKQYYNEFAKNRPISGYTRYISLYLKGDHPVSDIEFPTSIFYPISPYGQGEMAFNSNSISGDGHYLVHFMTVPKTGTIDKILMYLSAVSASGDLDFSIQTVNESTGYPSGTCYGSSGVETVEIDTTGLNEITLSAPATAVKGDLIAVVIKRTSGTFSGSIVNECANGGISNVFPYCAHYTTSFSKDDSTPNVSIGYDDGTYPLTGCMPGLYYTTAVFNTGTDPDEVGAKFKLPAGAEVVGAWIAGTPYRGSNIKLYDSNGSDVLATANHPAKMYGSTSKSATMYYFAETVNITKDTYYRLILEPTTTSSITTYILTTTDNKYFEASPYSKDFIHTYRTDGGDWTDDDTKQPQMGLIISKLSP